MRITIGHENPDPDLRQVGAGDGQRARSIPTRAWGLGVVGSTRMEYGRMIALVEHVARALNQTLKELRS